MTKENEHVMVIRTSSFNRCGYFQGFNSDVNRYQLELLDPRNTSYMLRQKAEESPEFKQLIPYCILYCKIDGNIVIFNYCRGKGQGETRLHGKRSIGIGGHVSLIDEKINNVPYQTAMRRELEEEVAIDRIISERLVGIINDDSNPVGLVHLGFVHLIELGNNKVEPRESEILDTRFSTIDELKNSYAGFESWSQICIENFYIITQSSQ